MERRFAVIEKYLKQRRLAIDVGAHIGTYASKMAGMFETVHAFEPAKRNYDLLVANTACYGNVTQHNYAVGASHGEAYFHIAGKSLSHHISIEPTDTVVQVRRLDAFKFECCDFLKVDVEGYEYFVLYGAVDLIRDHRPLVMIEEKFDPQRQASAFLVSLGYREVARIKHDRVFRYER